MGLKDRSFNIKPNNTSERLNDPAAESESLTSRIERRTVGASN